MNAYQCHGKGIDKWANEPALDIKELYEQYADRWATVGHEQLCCMVTAIADTKDISTQGFSATAQLLVYAMHRAGMSMSEIYAITSVWGHTKDVQKLAIMTLALLV